MKPPAPQPDFALLRDDDVKLASCEFILSGTDLWGIFGR